jgi:hypothetical protein
LLDMERQGKRIPTLINRPELHPYLLEPLNCFLACSTEKQIGMAVGPIPYRAIVDWAIMAGMTDVDEIDDLATVVWHADSMLSEHTRKMAKKKPIGGSTPQNTPMLPLPPPQGRVIGGPRRG